MEASAARMGPGVPRAGRFASARLLRVASDERLVAHVRAGSQAAFEVVYDRHHRGILSFCRHMLGSREEAEDAVQHTFMAAYRDLVGSDKDIQLRAWLYAIARNRCLSMLRARRERPSDELDEPVTEGLGAQVQQRADLRELLRDLAELPEDQRAALVLSEVGDMAHDEIAAVLGCPREKVKALVFQARTSLQQSREARETSCQEIRELLATLSGGALRRGTLRRHVRDCPGCQAFEAEVKRQRRAMAAVLPVVPTLGLKDTVLAATFSSNAAAGGAAAAGAAGVAAGGTAAAGGTSALVAKVLVVAAVASGGSVAGYQAVGGGGADAPAPREQAPGPSAGGGQPILPVSTPDAADREEEAKADKAAAARGKALAETRGKGKKHGLRGTQPGKANKQAAAERRAERAAARAERKAQKKARAKAKARKKIPTVVRKQRAKRVRPRPQAQTAPKPQPTPQPTPEAKPKATPEPAPTAVPEVDPEGHGKPQRK